MFTQKLAQIIKNIEKRLLILETQNSASDLTTRINQLEQRIQELERR